jgi:hypothetical protein
LIGMPPLWSETIKALKAVQMFAREKVAGGEVRYHPTDPADVDAVFLSKQQRRFVRHDGTIKDLIALAFGKLLRANKLKRMGVLIYTLRHTFKSQAMPTQDCLTVHHIMGHRPAYPGHLLALAAPARRVATVAAGDESRRRLLVRLATAETKKRKSATGQVKIIMGHRVPPVRSQTCFHTGQIKDHFAST